MTDYNTKSDAEINELVAIAEIKKGRMNNCEDVTTTEKGVMIGDGANWREFNPCNNPSDIMPIAIEHGMGMMKTSTAWSVEARVKINKQHIRVAYRYPVATDENLYRAIAICYLMMEGE